LAAVPAAPDVFYFGSIIGESDRSLPLAVVNRLDLNSTAVQMNPGPVLIDNRWDHNRDGRVSALDLLLIRLNQGRTLPLITAPPAANG
jgi:hypothetical protein